MILGHLQQVLLSHEGIKEKMPEYITTSIDGYSTRVKDPGAGKPALVTDYGKLDDYIDMYQKHYEEKRADFFDSTPEDADLPLKAKRWAAISKTFMGLARTLMRAYGEDDKYHEVSVEIADRITKDSGLRLRNLDLHYDLMKKADPNNRTLLDRLSQDVIDGMKFFNRAVATQTVMLTHADRVSGGPAGIEMREEAKAGERARALEEKVPDGHMFLPARPFPAVEIPEGIHVPEYPEAYKRYKSVDVDDLVYDEEHDEFIIRPGYISEDGLIDDESVVWNWDEGTVAIKFRGGEPEIWPFWKPKDAADIPKGWVARYLRRKYLDWADCIQNGILKRRY